MMRARRGELVNPSSPPFDSIPRTSSSIVAGSTNPGNTSSSTRRVSVRLPTGRIVVFVWPPAPLAEEFEARLTLISHQPAARHNRGWLT